MGQESKHTEKECEACGRPYIATRDWSKYCSTLCRETLTQINNQLLADIRQPVLKAAKKLARLHLRKPDE